MTNDNWKISFDRQFKIDVNRWHKKITDLQVELRGVIDYILEDGEIPAEYDSHELVDSSLPYTDNLDFHLFDGRVDLLVICMADCKI